MAIKNDNIKGDKVIMRLVNAYPTNLKYAFKMAASQLGRSEDSISGRYYAIRKDNKALVLVTKNGAGMSNVKNQRIQNNIALDVAEMALQKLTKDEKLMLIQRILAD